MNARDRWWWQATTWMEARGEGLVGQIAVAKNILNRLHDGRWGHTIGAVVLAPKQYSSWNSDAPTRKALAYVNEETDQSWLSVDRALSVAMDLTVDPTNGALHYYSVSIPTPAWDKPEYPRVQIGRHIFVQGVP